MVELWAEKRNFFKNDNTNTLQQSMKLLEETGELVAGINKNKKEEIKDAIGDMIVVMIIISKLENEKINQTLIFDDYPTEKEAEIDNYNLKDEKYWIKLTILNIINLIKNMVQEEITTESIKENEKLVKYKYKKNREIFLKEIKQNKKESINNCIYNILLELRIVANYYDLKIINCLNSAYNEISKRKWRMEKWIFIKEE